MLRYWDNPAATAEAFAGGWFHSGDVGTMDAEGYLFVVDRIKDVINTGGVLVASREVEDALFTHPAVAECAVIAMPDERWIEAVAAVVVLRDGCAATEDALVAHARASAGGVQAAEAGVLRRRAAEEHGRQAAEAGASPALCRARQAR